MELCPLVLDINGDGLHTSAEPVEFDIDADGGTLLPNGSRAANGFEALAVYDDPANGGDGNGELAVGDQMWGRLRLWVDRNHDGESTHDELATLAQTGITSLALSYDEGENIDDAENDHRFRGHYTRRRSGNATVTLQMNDIFFWPAQ